MPNRVGPLGASTGGAVDGAMMAMVLGDGDSNHSSRQCRLALVVVLVLRSIDVQVIYQVKKEVCCKKCAQVSGNVRVGVWPS